MQYLILNLCTTQKYSLNFNLIYIFSREHNYISLFLAPKISYYKNVYHFLYICKDMLLYNIFNFLGYMLKFIKISLVFMILRKYL